nr:MAG TPA: hypothetical protein [Caudoviricetes sp.]
MPMRKQPSCQMAAFAWVLASEQSQVRGCRTSGKLKQSVDVSSGTGGARPRDT